MAQGADRGLGCGDKAGGIAQGIKDVPERAGRERRNISAVDQSAGISLL